jgi:predicted dinucleotide-binding enzyme
MDAGYPVSVAASGDPQKIALIAQVVMPGAAPEWAADAVRDADIVVLAIPLNRFRSLDRSLFAGKIVVDAMNYWAPTDGTLAEFEDGSMSTSEIVQEHLKDSSVVKTFNHTGYHDFEEDRRRAGDPDRRAMGVAGDDVDAVEVVASLVEAMGYDAVRLGELRTGRILEPGGPAFGARLTRDELETATADELAA